ncbi:MAG: toll/interleukin-1 receptor domain-containing protein [Rhodospirillaceae bacterium]
MANVFISHRSADKPLAEKLALNIQAGGHTVWYDEWEIGIGDSIVAKIDEGLTGTGYLVLCLSSSGDSPWVSREWMSALSRQLEGKGVKVLPARLSGGDLPAILADIKFADLVKDWSRGVADLLKAIR